MSDEHQEVWVSLVCAVIFSTAMDYQKSLRKYMTTSEWYQPDHDDLKFKCSSLERWFRTEYNDLRDGLPNSGLLPAGDLLLRQLQANVGYIPMPENNDDKTTPVPTDFWDEEEWEG